jgi:hypothetical protein
MLCSICDLFPALRGQVRLDVPADQNPADVILGLPVTHKDDERQWSEAKMRDRLIILS